jgi:hypothetical protein
MAGEKIELIGEKGSYSRTLKLAGFLPGEKVQVSLRNHAKTLPDEVLYFTFNPGFETQIGFPRSLKGDCEVLATGLAATADRRDRSARLNTYFGPAQTSQAPQSQPQQQLQQQPQTEIRAAEFVKPASKKEQIKAGVKRIEQFSFDKHLALPLIAAVAGLGLAVALAVRGKKK